MEKRKTNKGLLWLIIAIAVIAVAAVVVGILYFMPPKKEAEPAAEPSDCEQTAQRFIEAYLTKDRLTQFDLFFYDARTQWEDNILKDHKTEEAFCDVVQQQADEQGIQVTINNFGDYLQEFHRQWKVDAQEVYGDYTVKVTATAVEAYSEEKSTQYVASAVGAQGSEYFADVSPDTVKQIYAVKVNGVIEGSLKTHNENYTVFLINYEGQWRVIGHTT